MAAGGDESYNWILEHFSELPNNNVKCKYCNQMYNSVYHKIIMWISHLYLKHGIYNEEEKLRWENDDDSVWKYFNKIDLYVVKCNVMLCNNVSDYMHNTDLKNHLKHIHSHEIAADKQIQTDIANNSLSGHFTISVEHFTVNCYHCKYYTDTLSNKITDLIIHYQLYVRFGNLKNLNN